MPLLVLRATLWKKTDSWVVCVQYVAKIRRSVLSQFNPTPIFWKDPSFVEEEEEERQKKPVCCTGTGRPLDRW